MKKIFLLMAGWIAAFLPVSCKKDNFDEGTTSIQVVAYKTGEGLGGVDVRIAQGINSPSCNCLVDQLVTTLQADNSGVCSIPNKYFRNADYRILLGGKIWPVSSGFTASKPVRYTAEYKAPIRLHLVHKEDFSYVSMQLRCSGELPVDSYLPLPKGSFPRDSIIIITGYGGQRNVVEWTMWDKAAHQHVGRDTVNVPDNGTTLSLLY
jgi:hypothetical protein